MPRGVYKRNKTEESKLTEKEMEQVVKKEEPVRSELVKEKPAKLVGHPIYTPKPDMGSVVSPDEASKVCDNCSHERRMHYGSERNWCNTSGCRCQAFV